jgi:hypothetical protein
MSARPSAIVNGLTAETVIGALEDAEDYKAFEAAVIADYQQRSDNHSASFDDLVGAARRF